MEFNSSFNLRYNNIYANRIQLKRPEVGQRRGQDERDHLTVTSKLFGSFWTAKITRLSRSK